MVKFWETVIKDTIAKKKRLIKIQEKNGLGNVVMKLKADLKKLEHKRDTKEY